MKKLFFVFSLIALLSACNKEESSVYVTELKVAIEGTDTKVQATPNVSGIKFEWEDEDEVYIFPAVAGNTSSSTYKYNLENESFELASGDAMVSGDKYFAVRGTRNPEEFNNGKISAMMYLSYNGVYWTLENLPMVSDIFEASGSGTIANLHHICGVLEIPFQGTGTLCPSGVPADYNYIEVGYALSGQLISGYVEVTFNDGDGTINKITKKGGDSAFKNYTISSRPGLNIELSSEPKSIYIPVLPEDYYTNVPIKWPYHSSPVLANTGRLTVERGKVHKKTTPIELNL